VLQDAAFLENIPVKTDLDLFTIDDDWNPIIAFRMLQHFLHFFRILLYINIGSFISIGFTSLTEEGSSLTPINYYLVTHN